MEWNRKKIAPEGSYRIKKKFAFFPYEFDDGKIVWLESYYILQRCIHTDSKKESMFSMEVRWIKVEHWKNKSFFSAREIKSFRDNLSLALTDSSENIREVANLLAIKNNPPKDKVNV